MLKHLAITDFMAFAKAEFELAQGLNVFVGANGTGKTQILKLMYTTVAAVNDASPVNSPTLGRDTQRLLHDKLWGVFRPGTSLANLIRRGASRTEVDIGLPSGDGRWWLDATDASATQLGAKLPISQRHEPPAYIPPAELLAIYPGLVSLYKMRHIEIEETWVDTCFLIGQPHLRVLDQPLAELLGLLEGEMQGRIELDASGRFYLLQADQSRTEMPLMAEGLRRLGLVARLIAVGACTPGSMLFWDEPETSLNPKLIKEVAKVIVALARYGVQVFVATHSLFLLRELYILQQTDHLGLDSRYFGLALERDGDRPRVSVSTGAALHDLDVITALDESLAQSQRFLEADQ